MNAGQIRPRRFGCSTVSSCFKSAWNSQPFDRTAEIARCFTVSRFCGEPQRNSNRRYLRLRLVIKGAASTRFPAREPAFELNYPRALPRNDEAVRQRRVFSFESIG